MRKKLHRAIPLILAVIMCLSLFSACGKTKTQSEVPLVVGYQNFSEKFSPFFADTAMDQDVVDMTSVMLLTTDRAGGIVYNAIDGEKIEYNGTEYTYEGISDVTVEYDESSDTTLYTFKIRDDVKFSDGEKLTADDVIFSYYVYCDPSYTGSTSMYSLPIVGLQNYRTQTTDEVYDKYYAMFDEIYAGAGDYTAEQEESYNTIMKDVWMADVQAIVDYCMANYLTAYAADTGFTAEEIQADEGLQIMFGMYLWGYGSITETGEFQSAVLGDTWDLTTTFPTLEDYYNECFAAYEGDPIAYFGVEAADDTDVYETARGIFISSEGPKDPALGGEGIPNISGIQKTGDYEIQVTVEGYDATAIYTLGQSMIAPLHYYGDESKYDYENNKFGFDFGDLSAVESKTTVPLGAGPYKFVKYENKVVYFEANEYYYKGEPITTYVQFKETTDADMTSGVGTGTIDLANPSFNTEVIDEIKGYNSNSETTGDVITTTTVDNLGYGYIGINAATVCVGGVADSDESKNLRRALATLFSVYRDVAIDSYYGERASVINYPISNTSWAAPQKTDEGYKVAFSTAADGSDIYTSDMSADDKYAAAIAAALDYFDAAGYTVANGKLTAAPAGAALEYEIIIPGDGTGDHPSFMICTLVKEALASIGMNLIINDPADSNVLWDALNANTQELWCAAWQATIDPDMYQIYYSNNIVGNEGSTESNHYNIQDTELDELIMAARESDDQSYRKTTYKACLDIIIDWAVEIPIYQRQNCFIFSSERIDMETVTPDITTFWDWMQDIEKLEMIIG